MAAGTAAYTLRGLGPDKVLAHFLGRKRRNLSHAEYSAFLELRAEYLCLDSAIEHPNARKLAEAIIEKERTDELNPDDIANLETALVRLEPQPRARQRLQALARTYSQMTGISQNSKEADLSDETMMRAAEEQLLNELHSLTTGLHRNQELCDRLFRTVSTWTMIVVTGVVALGTFCFIQSGRNWSDPLATKILWAIPYLPAVFYCMVAGATGAFLSSVLKVQDLAGRHPIAGSMLESQSLLSAGIAPAVGAFAGFLIFASFASGLLQGQLLPRIAFPDAAHCYSVFDGIMQAGPVDKLDNIKMLLAALASGFSERFFPDVMDWLGNGITHHEKVSESKET
jgi:hypothetical protein